MKEWFCEDNQGRLAKPSIAYDREDSTFSGTYFGAFCVSKYQTLLHET